MSSRLAADPRIDPRIKAAFGEFELPVRDDVESREQLLAYEESDQGRAFAAQLQAFVDACDDESIAPSAGLSIRTETFPSQPDGNSLNILLMRPDTTDPLPCVYYIHGGGMLTQSCFDGNYRMWGRMIAREGVMVAMIDFRNGLRPSSVAEVAPYPAGLNDCASGLRWVYDHADALTIDWSRIIIAGDSGGGNLALATGMKLLRDGDISKVAGIFALSPFIAGQWPHPSYPSSVENEGIFVRFHDNYYRVGYGLEAFLAGDPLAWPAFAVSEDVAGLPPVFLSLNECDPLRDEGLAFYRLLMDSGVRARCQQVMGTVHDIEIFPTICPEISRDTALKIARFARNG